MYYDVFISYSHKDQAFSQRLAQDLKDHGVSLFLDEWELNIGDSITDTIGKHIENTKYFCIILSKNSIKSDWVQRELKVAYSKVIADNNAKILPIVIDDCAIPTFLKDLVYADFKNHFDVIKYDLVMKKLLNSLDVNKKINIKATNVVHKIIVMTGVTTSGKDSLLSDAFNKKLKIKDNFYFLTKYTSRHPRGEERLLGSTGERFVPYFVNKVSRRDLELNIENQYFNIFEKYGNFTAFEKHELENVLHSSSNMNIVYIQADLDGFQNHIHEIEEIAKNIELELGALSGHGKVKIIIKKILIDCPVSDSRSRLLRRNLTDQSRASKDAMLKDDTIIADAIKKYGYFDYIINNSNKRPYDEAITEFIAILQE